jgi:hypothetical protein
VPFAVLGVQSEPVGKARRHGQAGHSPFAVLGGSACFTCVSPLVKKDLGGKRVYQPTLPAAYTSFLCSVGTGHAVAEQHQLSPNSLSSSCLCVKSSHDD